MYIAERFDNIGRRLTTASKTIAGNAAEALEFEGEEQERLGVILHNHSTELKVYLKLSKLDSGETVSAIDKDLVVSPEDTIVIRAGKSVRLWAVNSSGDATTSQIEAVEVR